jgi:hypothetical protein
MPTSYTALALTFVSMIRGVARQEPEELLLMC